MFVMDSMALIQLCLPTFKLIIIHGFSFVYRVNDCVVKVNNVDLTNVGDRTIALQAVKNSRGIINMVSWK